ncbi:MAG TPA: hypothetical protein GX497_17910 [Bacillus bacterium]|nr:hypothetical protein [Bacillus sp. (in: firmicutes)]
MIIFDHGYASEEMISIIDDKNIKYLMRLQKSFDKELDESNKEDLMMLTSA